MFVIWIVSAINSGLSALSYTELALLFPESGGDYMFTRKTLGNIFGFLIIAARIFVIVPGGAVLALYTFAEYSISLFHQLPCESTESMVKQIAVCLALFTCLVNSVSIKLGLAIQDSLWFIKYVALILICGFGLPMLFKGQTSSFEAMFTNTVTFTDYGSALISGMYAYQGWSLVCVMTDEVKKPEKTIPISLLVSFLMISGIYILTNIAYLAVMTPAEIRTSNSQGFNMLKYQPF